MLTIGGLCGQGFGPPWPAEPRVKPSKLGLQDNCHPIQTIVLKVSAAELTRRSKSEDRGWQVSNELVQSGLNASQPNLTSFSVKTKGEKNEELKLGGST